MFYLIVYKLGCVVRMVVDSILPHAESGPNDHRKDAPPFTNLALYEFIITISWFVDLNYPNCHLRGITSQKFIKNFSYAGIKFLVSKKNIYQKKKQEKNFQAELIQIQPIFVQSYSWGKRLARNFQRDVNLR